jgi:hypothetical protein
VVEQLARIQGPCRKAGETRGKGLVRTGSRASRHAPDRRRDAGRAAGTVASLAVPQADQMDAAVLSRHVEKACVAKCVRLIVDRRSEDMQAPRRGRVPKIPESAWPVSPRDAIHRAPDELLGLERKHDYGVDSSAPALLLEQDVAAARGAGEAQGGGPVGWPSMVSLLIGLPAPSAHPSVSWLP